LAETRAPPIQRLREAADLERIRFTDGVAAVMAPAELLEVIRFKNDRREDSPRLRAVETSIRRWGYQARDPVICRIGQKGRWIVVDGGHRLTAARRVARSWWANLFGRKVRDVYFLLFETPRSWRKSGRPEAAGPAPDRPPDRSPDGSTDRAPDPVRDPTPSAAA
jgi:hypothetical protein